MSVMAFILSVIAGVVSNYISKWLDRQSPSDNQHTPLHGCRNRTPGSAHPGVHFAPCALNERLALLSMILYTKSPDLSSPFPKFFRHKLTNSGKYGILYILSASGTLRGNRTREGGVWHGFLRIRALDRSKCARTLHMQMAGQRVSTDNQPNLPQGSKMPRVYQPRGICFASMTWV